VYLSGGWDLVVRRFSRELLVCRVILRSVFLKMLVRKVVSRPKYVKGVWVCFWRVVRLDCFGVGVLRMGIGKPLLCIML
jgi:hypothetical protein